MVREGRLDLHVPAEWPEGAEVEIWRLDQPAPEDDGPMSAEEIARVLAAMDAMQPFEMSEEERASVVSSDSDLHAVPGLSVENWSV